MTSVNPRYTSAISMMSSDITAAKRAETSAKKSIKDTKNVTGRKQEAARRAYSQLSGDIRGLREAKKNLLEDKMKIAESYKDGATGKKQKIKDIFKFCWGPKATIRREIRHLDNLQRTIERKLAKLDPEKFKRRKQTLISQDKVEKKLIKEDLRRLQKSRKDLSRIYKKLQRFEKMTPYIERKPQNPKKAIRDFKALTSRELQYLTGRSGAFHNVEKAMAEKPRNPQKVQDAMDILRLDIKNNQPGLKEVIVKAEAEIKELKKDLHPRKKQGYLEL